MAYTNEFDKYSTRPEPVQKPAPNPSNFNASGAESQSWVRKPDGGAYPPKQPSIKPDVVQSAPKGQGLLQRASSVFENMGGQMATATGLASQVLHNPMIVNQTNEALARHGLKGIISSGQRPVSNYAPTLADMGMNSQGKLDIPVQQPPAINPETKAWGERSIANIREGERNRMAAREKMQSMITDRQARAQAGLDARAAQQAQHQAWLDKPVDYARGGSSPSYSQRTDGAIMRDGQAMGLRQPTPRTPEQEQAIRDRLDDTYTRHRLRNSPQALATYAASRGDNATSRYQTDRNFENSGLERSARVANDERNFGLQERSQKFNEQQYNDQAPEREFNTNVARKKNEILQGENGFENLGLSNKPKDRYKGVAVKRPKNNMGEDQGETAVIYDSYTGEQKVGQAAYSPQEIISTYQRLIQEYGPEKANEMINNHFGNGA